MIVLNSILFLYHDIRIIFFFLILFQGQATGHILGVITSLYMYWKKHMTAIRLMKRQGPRATLSIGALSERKHDAMKSKFASPSDVNFSTIRMTENLGRQNWTSKNIENCINMIAAKFDEQANTTKIQYDELKAYFRGELFSIKRDIAKNQNDMKQRIDMLDAKMANIRKDATDHLEPSRTPN